MDKHFGSVIYPIIRRSLDLKDRLDRGESPDFDAEHRKLLEQLRADGEARRLSDYNGDGSAFLGARYALACWLDEIFIVDSPWAREWTDRTMEVELVGYGANERAWRFWRQAKKAAERPGTDALEVYLWCVMLGFRGSPESEGVNVAEWAERTRKHVVQGRSGKFPHEAGVPPKPDVPTLSGRRQFTRMLRAGAVGLAAAAFAATYLAFKRG